MRTETEPRVCCVCGKEYKYPADDGSDNQCCSALCEMGRFYTANCKECGVEYEVDQAHMTEAHHLGCCSNTCVDKFWDKRPEKLEF